MTGGAAERGQGDFGTRLRDARLAAGLSQEALAERAGLSADAVAALERGRRRAPRAATIGALASALDMSPVDRAALARSAAPNAAPKSAPDAAPKSAPDAAPKSAPDAAPAAGSVAGSVAGPVAGSATGSGATAPHPAAGLIGRADELAALTTLLRPGGPRRLVTLLGPGGVGKTVLASAAVAEVSDGYRDGSVFVDLSGRSDRPAVVAALARAMGLPEAAGRGTAELGRSLAGRETLVLLDSAERVPQLGPLLVDLTERAPGLTVLVTSRRPLGVPTEDRHPVAPLPVPPGGCGPADVAANPAVQLFVRRARAAAPDFRLADDNATAVAALCAQLGGLPLALELAAARIRVLPPSALLDRMDRRLDVLTGGSGGPDRHRSLRATLDWSYRLLTPPARRVFGALAVFRGGCTAEAAEAVCGGGAVLDHLTELVDAGMLVRTPQPGRLTMLDPVDEYARSRLARQRREPELRARHLAYYLDLAERAHRDLAGGRQADALAALDRDHDNLRAALDWATGHRPDTALRLAAVLSRFWHRRGYLGEGRRRLGRALATGAGADPARAEALHAMAVLAVSQGDLADAGRRAEESLTLYRAVGDRTGVAHALNVLGNVAREQGDLGCAIVRYQESLRAYRAVGLVHGVAASLNNLGTTAYYQRDFAKAAALHRESLALRRQVDDVRGVATCLDSLATVACETGDPHSAVSYGLESLAIREELADAHGSATVLIALAVAARACGEPDRAADYADRARSLGHTVGDPWIVAAALAATVGVRCDQARWEDAARTAGALSTQLDRRGSTLRPADAARLASDTATVRAALGEPAYTCQDTLGRAANPGGSGADRTPEPSS